MTAFEPHRGGDAMEQNQCLTVSVMHADPLRSKIMVLTTNDRECEVCAALQLGVHGYLLQSCSSEELALGVRAVVDAVEEDTAL
jgi:DNA-binding NarL/FixJ family response regulator